MSARLRVASAAVVMACLAFAGSASAGIDPFSGTVNNGGCSTARAVPVTGASRIEVAVSATAQDNNSVLAEIVAPNGKLIAGPGSASYDTTGSGSYQVRVCVTYAEQNPPQIQYTGQIGTGPAGRAVLTGATQPPPATGVGTKPIVVSGKAAIMTRSGLAWFTVATAPNATMTLRVVDPVHHITRLVKGLKGTYAGNTLRLSGNGVKLVLVQGTGASRVAYTSSRFAASGKVVRGAFHITA
jgi:hypothetical protein